MDDLVRFVAVQIRRIAAQRQELRRYFRVQNRPRQFHFRLSRKRRIAVLGDNPGDMMVESVSLQRTHHAGQHGGMAGQLRGGRGANVIEGIPFET